MNEEPSRPDLVAVINQIAPGVNLRKTWPLKGGISSRMTAFEVEQDGISESGILREPGEWAFRQNPNVAAHEFMLLEGMRTHGVPVPAPLALDGQARPPRFLVLSYIEGEPDYATKRANPNAKISAETLAAIHRAPRENFPGLPDQNERWQKIVFGEKKPMDSRQDEPRIRKVLKKKWPQRFNKPVVQHGDFWPGNIIWAYGEIAAVIDWEDAGIGDPLYDLAVSRLDWLWSFGKRPMETFTEAYFEANAVDPKLLPFWDLCAALRPIDNFTEWASIWPEVGRPDITEAHMRADHKWFVKQALKRLR